MIELWEHQTHMVQWMLGRKSGLVHGDMGVGKTLAAYTAIWRGEFERTLVLTKKKAIRVWLDEAEKFGFTDAGMVVYGNDDISIKKQAKELEKVFYDQAEKRYPLVVVLNYDRVWRDQLYLLLAHGGFEVMFLDESHKIKSHNGNASNAVFALSQRIPRRYLLTGTPMPNGPLDLFGQWRVIDPNLTTVHQTRRGFTVFREHYADLAPVRGAAPGVVKIVGYKNMDEFQRKMQATTLQIRAEDVLDLPEKLHIVRPVKLGKETYNHYKQLKNDMLTEINQGVVTVDNVLVKSLRLHQLAGGHLKADRSDKYVMIDGTKVDEVLDILDSLPPGEPLVVFAKYTAEIDGIVRILANYGYTASTLSGKHNQLQEWKDGKTQVLVVQIDTGAEAISLVRAKYVIYYSMDYSLGKYEQSLARVARPGQESGTVWYYYLIAQGTIDEAIYEALRTKAKVNEFVLGALSNERNSELLV